MNRFGVLLQSMLLQVQKWVLPRRIAIIWIFCFLELLLLAGWATVVWFAATDYGAVSDLIYVLGSKFGVLSLICYIVTLLPGILNRLRWLPLLTMPLSTLLMAFRRHFGILMFITAFIHMSFTTTLPQLVLYDFDPSRITLQAHQVVAMIAWWLLLPLWLTSNDISMRFMGKWWKRLQSLTYIALVCIFVHVALLLEGWAVILGVVLILEIASRVKPSASIPVSQGEGLPH